jgi:hypothetical protein
VGYSLKRAALGQFAPRQPPRVRAPPLVPTRGGVLCYMTTWLSAIDARPSPSLKDRVDYARPLVAPSRNLSAVSAPRPSRRGGAPRPPASPLRSRPPGGRRRLWWPGGRWLRWPRPQHDAADHDTVRREHVVVFLPLAEKAKLRPGHRPWHAQELRVDDCFRRHHCRPYNRMSYEGGKFSVEKPSEPYGKAHRGRFRDWYTDQVYIPSSGYRLSVEYPSSISFAVITPSPGR